MLKLSSGTQMLLALIFGVLSGLFWGEEVAWMEDLGRIFILLMQVTIYPYILVSLISGIGKLDPTHFKRIFSRAAGVMLCLWLLGLVMVYMVSTTFPAISSGSFFSSSLIQPPPSIDYYALYIPSNPFASLADGAVPAIVLFSMAFGFALVRNPNKQVLLDPLNQISAVLSKMTKAFVKLLPIGVFSISASAAGTLTTEQFNSLQVYLISALSLNLLLCFVVLPMVLAALTPVKYKEVIILVRTSLITAFSTGNVFITLPVLIEGIKEYLAKHNMRDEESTHMTEVLVPLAYTFPTLGKLTTLIFVLFAAWLTDHAVGVEDLPSLTLTALLTYFSNVHVAIPFLLETLMVPADTYQLYLALSVFTGKFVSATSVVYIVVFCMLCICVVKGFFAPGVLFKRINAGIFLFLGIALGLFGLSKVNQQLELSQDSNSLIANMEVATTVPADVLNYVPPKYEGGSFSLTTVETIRKRGVLRIGYIAENVPFSYFNKQGGLVGFDIDLAYQLAEDIGVEIEFIPFQSEQLTQYLSHGYFDIAMSGLEVNIKDIEVINFSAPVLNLSTALVAKDYELKSMASLEQIKAMESLRLATVETHPWLDKVVAAYPNIQVTQLDDYQAFFEHNQDEYDALVVSAEAGYAWSMFYPDYGVVVPEDTLHQYPTAFALAKNNQRLLEYVNQWLSIQQANGRVQTSYDYWILGKGAQKTKPRWSIKKDLLGW